MQIDNPFFERKDCAAYIPSAWGATLHSRATTAGAVCGDNFPCLHARLNDGESIFAWEADWSEESQVDDSFVYKLITDTVDGQNILRLAGFDFDLAANILDMRVDGAFVRFKCHAMDCVQ